MKRLLIGMLAVSVVLVLAAGCASTGGGGGGTAKAKGPTDTELINKAVADWKTAGIAKNVDGLLACYSDGFQNYEYGDKAGLQQFLKDALSMGYLEDAEIDMSKAKLTLLKGEATFAPIDIKAAFGDAGITLTLKKEAMGWKITSMDVEMH